jgi:ribosome-associated protein
MTSTGFDYTFDKMIPVTRTVWLDESELQFSHIRASGPGGQNVNKVASAVQLRFDIRASRSLPPAARQRLLASPDRRITGDGVLVITAQRFRTQTLNRADAISRLVALVKAALQPVKARVATRPTRAARQRRLEHKRRRGALKRRRAASSEPDAGG